MSKLKQNRSFQRRSSQPIPVTRYNRYNRFDNRLYTRYSRLSNRFDNLDNMLYRVNGALQTVNDSKSMIMHMHDALKRESFAVSLDLHTVSEGLSTKF